MLQPKRRREIPPGRAQSKPARSISRQGARATKANTCVLRLNNRLPRGRRRRANNWEPRPFGRRLDRRFRQGLESKVANILSRKRVGRNRRSRTSKSNHKSKSSREAGADQRAIKSEPLAPRPRGGSFFSC